MKCLFLFTFVASCASTETAATTPAPVQTSAPTATAQQPADDGDARTKFVGQCVGADPRKSTYCDCVWTTLRKSLSASDLLGDPTGPVYDAARKDVAVACRGTLSEEVARAHYVDDCPPQYAAVCRCVWKTLRATATTEEIASGLVDAKPAIETCKPQASP